MSDQQWQQDEPEGTVVRTEPELVGRVERGPPSLGEMVSTYIFTCPDCGATFNSYHTVTRAQQLTDMCPKCNSRGQKLKRTQVNTLRNEFAVQLDLVHSDNVRYDDYGFAEPILASRTWSILRVPTSVRKKYGIHLRGRYIGLFGPLIVRAMLDAGDRQIMGIEKFPLANTADDGKKKYEGASILRSYLLEHGKKVAWSDSSRDPIPAYDDVNKSPYVISFEYHRQRGVKAAEVKH